MDTALLDLNFLTDSEKAMIMEVLNRDEKIQKRENERIERLKNKAARTNNPIIKKKIKMRTGEWFIELMEPSKNFKQSGRDTIRASIRMKNKGLPRRAPIPPDVLPQTQTIMEEPDTITEPSVVASYGVDSYASSAPERPESYNEPEYEDQPMDGSYVDESLSYRNEYHEEDVDFSPASNRGSSFESVHSSYVKDMESFDASSLSMSQNSAETDGQTHSKIPENYEYLQLTNEDEKEEAEEQTSDQDPSVLKRTGSIRRSKKKKETEKETSIPESQDGAKVPETNEANTDYGIEPVTAATIPFSKLEEKASSHEDVSDDDSHPEEESSYDPAPSVDSYPPGDTVSSYSEDASVGNLPVVIHVEAPSEEEPSIEEEYPVADVVVEKPEVVPSEPVKKEAVVEKEDKGTIEQDAEPESQENFDQYEEPDPTGHEGPISRNTVLRRSRSLRRKGPPKKVKFSSDYFREDEKSQPEEKDIPIETEVAEREEDINNEEPTDVVLENNSNQSNSQDSEDLLTNPPEQPTEAITESQDETVAPEQSSFLHRVEEASGGHYSSADELNYPPEDQDYTSPGTKDADIYLPPQEDLEFSEDQIGVESSPANEPVYSSTNPPGAEDAGYPPLEEPVELPALPEVEEEEPHLVEEPDSTSTPEVGHYSSQEDQHPTRDEEKSQKHEHQSFRKIKRMGSSRRKKHRQFDTEDSMPPSDQMEPDNEDAEQMPSMVPTIVIVEPDSEPHTDDLYDDFSADVEAESASEVTSYQGDPQSISEDPIETKDNVSSTVEDVVMTEEDGTENLDESYSPYQVPPAILITDVEEPADNSGEADDQPKGLRRANSSKRKVIKKVKKASAASADDASGEPPKSPKKKVVKVVKRKEGETAQDEEGTVEDEKSPKKRVVKKVVKKKEADKKSDDEQNEEEHPDSADKPKKKVVRVVKKKDPSSDKSSDTPTKKKKVVVRKKAAE